MINYLYPLLLVLLLWQCQDADLELRNREVSFGETFSIIQEEQVMLTGEGEDLQLYLKTVNDSRCPANAICVWLGNATVTLKVANAHEEKELQMCIGDCRPEPARSKHVLEAAIGGVNYKFTLKDVMPYPGTEKAGDAKQVKLMVEKVTL